MASDIRQEERKKEFKDLQGPELVFCREEYASKLRKSKRQTCINSKRFAELAHEDKFNNAILLDNELQLVLLY